VRRSGASEVALDHHRTRRLGAFDLVVQLGGVARRVQKKVEDSKRVVLRLCW
jgi:hypothetical protein